MKIVLCYVCIVFLSCLMPKMTQAQAEYPDVPYEDTAYSNLAILFQRGILQEGLYPVFAGRIRPRAMTNYEFAVGLARLFQEIEEEDKLRAAPNMKAFPPDALVCHPQPVVKIREKLASHPDAAKALRQLCERFHTELNSLGLSDWNDRLLAILRPAQQPISGTNNKLGTVASPFKDLTRGH